MAALVAARHTKVKLNNADRYRIFPIASGVTIFPGAIVAVVAGEARPAAAAGGGVIAGWADMDTTPGEGATEDTISAYGTGFIRICEGEAWFNNDEALDASDIGSKVYAQTDQDIRTTAGTLQLAGCCVDVDADLGVLVHMGLAYNAALAS